MPVIRVRRAPTSSRTPDCSLTTSTPPTSTRRWPTSTACERSLPVRRAPPKRTVDRPGISRSTDPSGTRCRSTIRCFAPSRSAAAVGASSSRLRLLILRPSRLSDSGWCCHDQMQISDVCADYTLLAEKYRVYTGSVFAISVEFVRLFGINGCFDYKYCFRRMTQHID